MLGLGKKKGKEGEQSDVESQVDEPKAAPEKEPKKPAKPKVDKTAASGVVTVRDALAASGTGAKKLRVLDQLIESLAPGEDVEAASPGRRQHDGASLAIKALLDDGRSTVTLAKAVEAADTLK